MDNLFVCSKGNPGMIVQTTGAICVCVMAPKKASAHADGLMTELPLWPADVKEVVLLSKAGTSEVLRTGKELKSDYCALCHSDPHELCYRDLQECGGGVCGQGCPAVRYVGPVTTTCKPQDVYEDCLRHN